MNWKNFALRFAGLIVIALAMFPLFGFTVNMLVFFKLVPAEMVDKALGADIIRQSMYVWMASLPFGFASLFFQASWKYILYFSPLYAPSLFAIAYTVLH